MNKPLLFTFFFVFFQTAFTQNFDFVDDDKGDSHDMITDIDAGIKIPLHSVKINGSSIPIYLTYNKKSGLVADVPSSVGFGWNLEAGGSIEKQINHLVDESLDGWFFNDEVDNIQSGIFTGTGQGRALYKSVDVSPDIFNLNISNGESSSFFYERIQGPTDVYLKPYILNQNFNIGSINMNFQLLQSYTLGSSEENFYQNDDDFDVKIKNSEGINYIFRKGIKRERPYDLERRDRTVVDSFDYKNYYLHKLYNDFSNDVIDFQYTNTTLKKLILHGEATRVQTNNEPQTPPGPNDEIITINYYQDISIEDVSRKEITKIITKYETVEFIYKEVVYNNSVGQTLSQQPQSVIDALEVQVIKLLDEIKIYDHHNNYVKGYQFFYTEQTQSQNDYEGALKLKYILKVGKNHKDTFVYKKFNYYPGVMETTSVTAKDVFGYPNGVVTNGQFQGSGPGMVRNSTPIHLFSNYSPSNMLPNESYMITGMLKSITNESGGKVEYIYQENTFDDIYYGGLLFKAIQSYDSNNDLISETVYKYEDPEGFGIPIFDNAQYNQGQIPLNGYDEGYYEGVQHAWHTYFTKRDPFNLNENYLTAYKVSNFPFSYLKHTPLIQAMINNYQLNEFNHQEYGSFYSKITKRSLNINNGLSEKGYTIDYYKPDLSGFHLNSFLARSEIYNSDDFMIREKIYDYDLVNLGYVNAHKFDNIHFSGYRYIIKDLIIPKIKNILKSIEDKEYSSLGVFETTSSIAISYLDEEDLDINTTDFNRRKRTIKYHNGVPYEKEEYKYLSEYANSPVNLEYLETYINPVVEKNIWVKVNSDFKLKSSTMNEYLNNGKLNRQGFIIGDSNNQTFFNENNYTSSSYDSNGNLIINTDDIIEYGYDSEGNLIFEKNLKSTIGKYYQWGNEYEDLYVDAILVSNISDAQFLKKSFENSLESGVYRFNKAFSGDYVFNGQSITIGAFPNGYQISFWSYENDEWKFNAFVHGGGNLTINKPSNALFIDELRVQPPSTTLNSFTLIPLMGPTSNLNERGEGERIEYNLFGKPLYLLDKNHKVLKEFRTNNLNIDVNN